jgi:hypothetical protein
MPLTLAVSDRMVSLPRVPIVLRPAASAAPLFDIEPPGVAELRCI